jgi:NAD(P)H-quinone oxidoreductase subunit 5
VGRAETAYRSVIAIGRRDYTVTTISLWLIALGPLLLAGVGVGSIYAPARVLHLKILLAKFAAAVTVTLAVGCAVSVVSHGLSQSTLIGIAGLGLSLYLDALSATMFCLVSFIGLIVIVYSHHNLDGDPGQGRFMGWLCLTLAAILSVIVAGNLLQFFLAWVGTSLGLHRLLIFYPHRQAAILAARKKFIASRLGDLCLAGAMVLLYREVGSLEYAGLFKASAHWAAASAPIAIHAAALLLVVAALLTSAQFPTHGWLIEVMETPTPVSALLHAGIINAGGFLVLRFAHLITLSTASLYTLAIVGGLTALFGSIVMLTQTSIKVSLAYSTIAQMGFMMLECGLGAYSAALLHIAAHSLYKAHAFLSSGSVIDIARASWTPSPGGQPHPARMAISIGLVLVVTAGIGALFGATLTAKPGTFALGSVLALGLIHLIANGIDERPNSYVVLRTVSLAAVVAIVYFALQWATEQLLSGTVPSTERLHGPVDLAIVVAVICSFGLVTLFQSVVPRQANQKKWQALYAHIANGFYVNTLANRWILHVWPSPPGRNRSRDHA